MQLYMHIIHFSIELKIFFTLLTINLTINKQERYTLRTGCKYNLYQRAQCKPENVTTIVKSK